MEICKQVENLRRRSSRVKYMSDVKSLIADGSRSSPPRARIRSLNTKDVLLVFFYEVLWQPISRSFYFLAEGHICLYVTLAAR